MHGVYLTVQDGLIGEMTDMNGGATLVTDIARSWVGDTARYISKFLTCIFLNFFNMCHWVGDPECIFQNFFNTCHWSTAHPRVLDVGVF